MKPKQDESSAQPTKAQSSTSLYGAEVEITEEALAHALFYVVDGNDQYDLQGMTGLSLNETSAIYKLAHAAAKKHKIY